MSLGTKIRELRKGKQMTQTELGEVLGVQQPAIRKYEYGEVDIPISKLQALADFFGVSVNYLLGEDSQEALGESDDTISKEDILFALYDGDVEDISDEMYEEVKRAVRIVVELERQKRREK
jgi:transcriptional regulator with XRE-family HTH domain